MIEVTDRGQVSAHEPVISCIRGVEAVEAALQNGILREWSRVAEHDPSATFLQGPLWTLLWYRAYRASYDAAVLAVESEGALVGVASLAVAKSGRELVFAGAQMADYRDVATLPAWREAAVRALVRFYRDGKFSNVLRVGPVTATSETPRIAERIAREEGVGLIARTHSGWQWWPEESARAGDPLKKRSVRYKMNVLKRRGPVVMEKIAAREEWLNAREEFFEQHSLRQLAAGRPVSFDNPEKRAFFDALFDSTLGHVTVLRVNGAAAAYHYGCASEGVLYLGAPSFDIRDQQYSPGLLLVAMIMDQSAQMGLRGFDLTMGGGDLKERLSTTRLDLPTVELYASRVKYWKQKAVDAGVGAIRRGLQWIGREDLWNRRIRPALVEFAEHLSSALHMPRREAIEYVRDLTRQRMGRDAVLIFEARSAAGAADGALEIRTDQIYDVLKYAPGDRLAEIRLSAAARTIAEGARTGAVFHSVLRCDRAAAWGFSRILEGERSEAGIEGFAPEAGSAMLYDFRALYGHDGVLRELIARISQAHAGNGRKVFLVVSSANRELRRMAEAMGFARLPGPEGRRGFRWKRE